MKPSNRMLWELNCFYRVGLCPWIWIWTLELLIPNYVILCHHAVLYLQYYFMSIPILYIISQKPCTCSFLNVYQLTSSSSCNIIKSFFFIHIPKHILKKNNLYNITKEVNFFAKLRQSIIVMKPYLIN